MRIANHVWVRVLMMLSGWDHVGLWPLRHVDAYMGKLEARGVFKHEDLAQLRAERNAEFTAEAARDADDEDLLQAAFDSGKRDARTITEANTVMERAKGYATVSLYHRLQ